MKDDDLSYKTNKEIAKLMSDLADTVDGKIKDLLIEASRRLSIVQKTKFNDEQFNI